MIATMADKFYRVIVAIAIMANIAGAFVILVMVALMDIDVVARGVFNSPFRGVVELVIFSMVLIVFLQLPDVVRTGRLTRSDGLLSILRVSHPNRAIWLGRIIDVISAIFFALITWTVWPEFVESFESCHFFTAPELGVQPTGAFWADLKVAFKRCDYFGTPGILTAPWWPARLAIFFGCAMASLLFLAKAIKGDEK